MAKGAKVVFERTPLGNAARGVLTLINDGAAYTVSESAVHRRFGKQGHDVGGSDDIAALPLEAVDRAVGFLGARYKSIAGTEGTATGAVGTLGPWWGAGAIAVDVPAGSPAFRGAGKSPVPGVRLGIHWTPRERANRISSS